MTEMVNLTINDQPIQYPAGETILKAAQSIGITIPTICYHDACKANALCRICVVEVQGSRTLVPSCAARISEGMVVQTHTLRVLRARKTILEMLNSSVDLSDAPEIQTMLDEYGADRSRYPQAAAREADVLDDNPMYIRDYTKCILCWRCVQVCAEDAQYTYAINFTGRGYETQIGTFYNRPLKETTCVFCGQCVGVCPTGALKPRRQWLMELGKGNEEINALSPAPHRKKRKAEAHTASGEGR